jgi:NADH-quinone oxidoreductase subunit N
VVVLNFYLGGWHYHHVLWLAAVASIVLLANVLFVISELKVFIAYMSVFHSTYILMGALGSVQGAFASSIAYLVLYMVLVVHFMCVVLVLRGRNLQFLTDLQGLSSVPGLSAGFICVFAAMSGIPPLAGFWAKIAIISSLLSHSEVALATLALAGGLLLMYFYLQNYRFNTATVKSFAGACVTVVDSLGGLFCLVGLGVLLNVGALFLVNDLWNLCAFFVEASVLEV